MLTVSFRGFIHQYFSSLETRVRTLRSKKNDAALVCFSAVEDLRGFSKVEDSTWNLIKPSLVS
jgi:hypothetical protein